jgi:diamine N-acetyltransferase
MTEAPPPASIRRATPSDVAALSQLGADTFVEAFGHLYSADDLQAFLSASHSRDYYRRLLDSTDVATWVAEDDSGRCIAYAVAGPCTLPLAGMPAGAGELRRLYVRATAHGHHLGTRLLQVALDWLRACGLQPVHVGVWSKNAGAQRLYARHGFVKVGEYDFPVGRQLDREFILRQDPPGA